MKRSVKRLCCAMLAVWLAALAPLAVSAETVEEIRAQQQQLEEENQELNAKLESLREDEAQKQAYRETLQEQIDLVQQQVLTTRENIQRLNESIEELTLKLEASQREVQETIDAFKERLVALYTAGSVSTLEILLDAMSQLFFSLSVSMGIMITYGSYVKKDVDLNKAVSQIEIMDTGVAFLAGVMIIPAVFVFSGLDGMSAGPGLMFVSLPKVFYCMGVVGRIIGILFFVLAGFAALTSCISVLESITANCMELFHTERKKTTRVLSVIYLIATAVIALGYSVFYVEVALPNGSTGQLLDIMDYISNSFMMPFISLLSAILIGWIMKPSWIAEEMELNGKKFKRKKLYNVMMRYIMPVIMMILFLQSTGVLNLCLLYTSPSPRDTR